MSMLSKLKGLLLLVLALAIGALVVVGCGSSSSSSSSSPSANLTGDGQPNIDLTGNREAKSEINSGNVSQLKQAWSIPVEGQGIYGSYASTPLIINGVVYSQDLESNVSAIASRWPKAASTARPTVERSRSTRRPARNSG